MSCLLFLIFISSSLFVNCYSFTSLSKVRVLKTKLHDVAIPIGDTTDDKVACGLCPNAPKCKGDYRDKGCDGTGKIQGGIGTVLTWWPIKVFRPCPSYLAAGYQYRREGQTMDQVLFSEPSEKMKKKLEVMRLQRELEEEESKNAVPPKDNLRADGEEDAAQKLLNEKFGKSK
jgi:hypothetical protein